MTETRLFDVVYGLDGEDQRMVMAGQPMWAARRIAMQVCASERDAQNRKGNDALAATFDRLFYNLQSAECGSVVFGHVERYTGALDRPMFIAILPTGTNYQDAGQRSPTFGRNGRTLFTPTTR